MAEETQLPLDSLPMKDYIAARDGGNTQSISKGELEERQGPQPTGKEQTLQEYKEKRSAKGGLQSRFDKLTKQRVMLETQLATERQARQDLEARLNGNSNGNGNGAEAQARQETESASKQAPTKRTADDPRVIAARDRYSDFDKVAKSGSNIRVADEAAKVLNASPLAPHISYFIARDPELASKFTKLPPAQQVREIERIAWDVAEHEPGANELAQAITDGSSPEQLEAFKDATADNPFFIHAIISHAQELLDLSNGVEVCRALVSDPELAQHIASLPKAKQAVALGRISQALEAPERIKSNAPPPIRPVTGAKTRSTVPLDQMGFADYRKARRDGRVR